MERWCVRTRVPPISPDGVAIEFLESRPDGFGIVMVQIVEDLCCSLPAITRGLRVSAGLMCFAETDQGVRPIVAVVNVCIGAKRLLVEHNCLAVAAGQVVAETEAVKG